MLETIKWSVRQVFGSKEVSWTNVGSKEGDWTGVGDWRGGMEWSWSSRGCLIPYHNAERFWSDKILLKNS